ncbi:MAG TPA: endonuclease Q family protein [Spirochaetota bacterium]|nr:endonuclease Q family protein [Spirochaetota bacterium]HOM37629.1 endonuclease Q family protein [Spirochaetota bacterium]HPQ49400.1 endonuclease Q family protein [Spirochaetota bacterium]
MELILDLHSHSGYSGGVGKIDMYKLSDSMKIKGIDIYGTGDILHPLWSSYLRLNLIEESDGIFKLKKDINKSFFILQSEFIASYPYTKNSKKSFHLLILFPSFDSVLSITKLFEKWGVKNTIGRPFLVCSSKKELIQRLFSIKEVNSYIEIIPAHIMTPEGVLGSKSPVYYIEEVFDEFKKNIYAIETGLSADPFMLEAIPELSNLSFISNSDSHSVSPLRIGREFTCIKVEKLSYKNIIDSIRNNNILYTGEFNPMEGRYFLTGHRGTRSKHNGKSLFFNTFKRPKKCSICNKEFQMGVIERTIDIALHQGMKEFDYTPKRNYISIIPLIEIISIAINKKTDSKEVLNIYRSLIEIFGNEINLFSDKKHSIKIIENINIDDKVKKCLIDVLEKKFTYDPPGFDGEYGKPVIGQKIELKDFIRSFLDRP